MSGIKKEIQNRTEEEKNIKTVRQVFEAFNTGDVSRVHEFISPQYFNHESQIDPVRSKLRGLQEFIDTVRNLRNAFDNLKLSMHPIVLGKGIPLFKNLQGQLNLKLVKSIPYQNGLMQLYYKPEY